MKKISEKYVPDKGNLCRTDKEFLQLKNEKTTQLKGKSKIGISSKDTKDGQ